MFVVHCRFVVSLQGLDQVCCSIMKLCIFPICFTLITILVDVVFDILYEEAHGSIIHLPLNDRQELLKKTVTQVEPRFITVLPGIVFLACHS